MSLTGVTSSTREEAPQTSVVQVGATSGMLHSQAQYNGNGTQVNGELKDGRIQTLGEISSGTFSNSIERTEMAARTIIIHNHYYGWGGQAQALQGPPQDTQCRSLHVARWNASNPETDRQGVFNLVVSLCEVVWRLWSSCLRYVCALQKLRTRRKRFLPNANLNFGQASTCIFQQS